MYIDVVTKDNHRISANRAIPGASILRSKKTHPTRRYFTMQPGRIDLTEEDGPECLVIGTEYIINNRRYDLATGYGIKARITTGYNIVPELRDSKGKERVVIKDKNNKAATPKWPIVQRIWSEENNEEIINPFIEKALEMSLTPEILEETEEEEE